MRPPGDGRPTKVTALSQTANSPTPAPLVRGIRRWDLVALVINGVVGAGIFGLPSKAYVLANTYSLFALLVCAFFASFIILCFAEVSSRFSATGGPYLYAREAAGPTFGFVIGWLMWLTRVTAFATVCNLLVTYLAYFWPAANSAFWRPCLITAIVLLLVVINIVGIREVAVVSNILTVAKLVPLFLFAVVGCFFVNPQSYSLAAPPDFGSFSMTVMLFVFAFSGFESATVTAGEVRDPQRNFPYALFVAITVVATLYLLIQFVCIGTVPELASSERPLADAANRFLGSTGGSIIVLGAVVSMAGTLNAALLAGTRLPFAMATDGCLPGFLAAIHRRFRTPHLSIIASATVTLAVTLSYTFMSALALNIITRLVIYGTTCACVWVLRRRPDQPPAGFTVPGGVTVPIAALLLCAWLLSQSTWRDLRDIAVAAFVGVWLHLVVRRMASGRPMPGRAA